MKSENIELQEAAGSLSEVEEFKRRILSWSNPVEFVNNMYGCHPGDEGSNYFEKIFSL